MDRTKRPLDVQLLVESVVRLDQENPWETNGRRIALRSPTAESAWSYLYRRFGLAPYASQELRLHYKSLKNCFGLSGHAGKSLGGESVPHLSTSLILIKFLWPYLHIAHIDDAFLDSPWAAFRRLKDEHRFFSSEDHWNQGHVGMWKVKDRIMTAINSVCTLSQLASSDDNLQMPLLLAETGVLVMDLAWLFDFPEKQKKLNSLADATSTAISRAERVDMSSAALARAMFQQAQPCRGRELFMTPGQHVPLDHVKPALQALDRARREIQEADHVSVRGLLRACEFKQLLDRRAARLYVHARDFRMARRLYRQAADNQLSDDHFGRSHLNAYLSQLEEQCDNAKKAIELCRRREAFLASHFGDSLDHQLGAERMRLVLLGAANSTELDYATRWWKETPIDFIDTLDVTAVDRRFPGLREIQAGV